MAKTIDDYKKDWATANAAGDTKAMEAAHAGAEALRAAEGYSGGADGSQYIPITNTTTSNTNNQYAGTNYHQDAINAAINGDWNAVTQALNAREAKVGSTGENYGKTSAQIYSELLTQYGNKTPEYESKNSTQIDALLNSILNRQDFKYDYTTDPSYLAYADQYKRLGDRAREDTLGNVAALNGGYASSWATSAASQAQNDYNQQLSNVIPTLYDAAYNRYMDDYNMDVANLGLLMNVDDTNYNRYRDTVSDSQWQQQFDYTKDRNEVSDNQWEQTFDWNKTVDQWNMDNTAATQKFDQLMTKWQLTGVADEEVAAELGVPVGATTESYYFNKAQLERDNAKLAKSGSGNDTKTETYEAKKGREIVLQTARAFMSSGSGSGSQAYVATANVILSQAGMYGLGMEDYFTMCEEVGIPEETANNVWMAKLSEYNSQPQDGGYEYYANLMGKADDPEEWLESNKYSLPEGMYDKLLSLL